jgi:hypothetical protein
MHPRGTTRTGILVRHGLVRSVGVPWLHDQDRRPVLVRTSRAVGLPAPLPDLLGFAVRVDLPDGPVDLLLTSCGLGSVTRALLVPQRDATCAYGSLMTYGSPLGRVRLLAVAEAPLVEDRGVLVLAAAFARGPWEPYGRIELSAVLPDDGSDPARAFDAVLHAPPGLRPDGPVARFRTPAYASVREARRAVLRWAVPSR